MRNISSLPQNRILSNIKVVPDGKDLRKGSAFLLLTDDLDSSKEIIGSGIFSSNHIRYFYTERFMSFPFLPARVQFDRTPLYKEISAELPIAKSALNIQQLRLNNFYFDTSREISALKSSSRLKSRQNRVEAFVELVKEMAGRAKKAGYERSTICMRVPAGITDIRKEFDSVITLFLWALRTDPTAFSALTRSGVEFMLTVDGLSTVIRLAMGKKSDINRIIALITTLARLANKEDLTPEDMRHFSKDVDIEKLQTSNGSADHRDILRDNTFFYASEENLTALTPEGASERVFVSRKNAVRSFLQHNNVDIRASVIHSSEDSLEEFAKTVKGYLYSVANSEELTIKGELVHATKEVKLKRESTLSNWLKESEEFAYAIDPTLRKNAFADKIFTHLVGKFNSRKGVELSDEEKEIMDDVQSRLLEMAADADNEITFEAFRDSVNVDDLVTGKLEEMRLNRIASAQRIKEKRVIDELRRKQETANVTVDGKSLTISDILKQLPVKESKAYPIDTFDESIKHSVSNDIDTKYRDEVLERDLIEIIQSFSGEDASIPVFVSDIQREDTSTNFDLKETLTVSYNIPGRKPQVLKVDIPKLTADGYLFLNGSKKFISKQIISLPITKVVLSGEDVVQFTTNYNKAILSRIGNRVSPHVTKVVKLLKSEVTENGVRQRQPAGGIREIILGDATTDNAKYTSNLEYNELSSSVVRIKAAHTTIVFDRKKLEEELLELEIEPDLLAGTIEGAFPIGYVKSGSSVKIVLMSDQAGKVFDVSPKDTSEVLPTEATYDSITDLIVGKLGTADPAVHDRFSSQSVGKKFTYSAIKVVNRKVPLSAFIAYQIGISEMMDRYAIEHEFTDKPRSSKYNRTIRFSNGYLHYNGRLVRNSLLMSGIQELKPEIHEYSEYEAKGTGYSDYFLDIGAPNLGKAFDNFFSLFIDPITKGVMDDLGIPSEMTEALLYCNTLLESSVKKRKNDMGNYRIRGAESMNAMLYKIMANAIKSYRDSSSSPGRNPSLSVKQNVLMREVLDSPIVEELPLQNPVKESMSRTKTTFKGPGGSQYGFAQGTEEVRAFDKSMVGVFAPTTTDDGNVGITRQLSMNPVLDGNRGYINKDSRKLNASNMLSTAELMSPYTAQHADPPRQGMQARQTGHQLPTLVQHKALVGSGAEKALAYNVGDDFVWKAVQDGKVKSIDPTKELVIIEYADGTTAAIDLASRSIRTDHGFYINVQLDHSLKVGTKFKAGEILAKDPSFFNGGKNDVTMLPGRLSKVAITPLDMTFEDSSLITQSLASDLGSKISFLKNVSLSYTANVSKVKVKGDDIRASEPLVVFEETFGDDADDISKLLDKLGGDLDEGISEFSKSTILSKYTGSIVDMRVYYNRPLEEYSDSLRKLINSYTRKMKGKSDALKDTRKDHVVVIPSIERVETNKVHGVEFDGILIQYYIQTVDEFRPGSKITFEKALKSIVSTVLEEGDEPYTDLQLRPDEKVDAIVSPTSTASRMVMDVYMTMWTNKILVGLKDTIRNM